MPVIHRAKKLGCAHVGPNATVKNRAVVAGEAQVLGHAIVGQNATVAGKAQVGGGALVEGTAQVLEEAMVSAHAHVAMHAELGGDVLVEGTSVVLTGPFTGGVFVESPLQVVIGRHIVGVDHTGSIVGLNQEDSVPLQTTPRPALTRWEAYVLKHLETMLESMAYKTPEEYIRAIGDEAAHAETHIDGPHEDSGHDTAPDHIATRLNDHRRDTVPLSNVAPRRPRVRVIRGGR